MLQANNPQEIYSRKRKNYFEVTGQGKLEMIQKNDSKSNQKFVRCSSDHRTQN